MNIPVDINLGSNPAIDERINNPRLKNMYVSKDGSLNSMASIKVLASINNTLAIHETTYNSGAYIVATKNDLLRVDSIGNIDKLASIKTSGATIRIKENEQNEIIVVTGANAYVYKQRTTIDNFVTLGEEQNFDLLNPVDVVVINTFAIIVGGEDKKWSVSSPNNAVSYSDNDVFITDESMGVLTGCAELNNNLFIFGQNGMQRWVPSIERTPEDLPFDEDPDFRKKFGAISTSSIVSETDRIYFLSADNHVRSISSAGLQKVTSDGIANLFSSYINPQFSKGSMVSYQSSHFYYLSFPDDDICWVFCESSGKWSETDILIIGAAEKTALYLNTVITKDGVYETTNVHNRRALEFNTHVILPPDSTSQYRDALNAVKLDLIQGLSQTEEPQHIELSISLDNLKFSNRINRAIGFTGVRNANTRWNMNILGEQFTLNFRYDGDLDLTIRRLVININEEQK